MASYLFSFFFFTIFFAAKSFYLKSSLDCVYCMCQRHTSIDLSGFSAYIFCLQHMTKTSNSPKKNLLKIFSLIVSGISKKNQEEEDIKRCKSNASKSDKVKVISAYPTLSILSRISEEEKC